MGVKPVRAAGGVVWRPGADGGAPEVCLVHRPRYDDWSLPKGKLDPDEHPMLAAVREVAEEADVRAVPQLRLSTSRYLSQGRPKLVDYWSMRAVGTGGFLPGTEVDDIRWLPVEDALRTASYPDDARVLREFRDSPPVETVLALVRHASAYRRGTWSGPDDARPLDPDGVRQAGELAPLVALFRPERLIAAPALRCVRTIGPAAELLDLPVEVDSAFAEPRPGQQVEEKAAHAAGRLVELARAGTPVAVCSQGKVVPRALDLLAGPGGHRTDKGGGWLLAFHAGRLVGASRL